MLVKTKVMAENLGVKVETLRAWAQAGKIPVVRISRRTIRFDPVDVEAALKGINSPAMVYTKDTCSQ